MGVPLTCYETQEVVKAAVRHANECVHMKKQRVCADFMAHVYSKVCSYCKFPQLYKGHDDST